MKLNPVLRSWARRWYISAGFVVITLAAVFLSLQVPGVYWTRVEVRFLGPLTASNMNTLDETTESLIAFAATVEREYTGNAVTPRFSTQEATLYGAGVREGSTVALRNTGGQWVDSFRYPVLDVEVVGASEADVRAQLTTVLSRIEAIADARQDAAEVSPTERIASLVSPQVAVVNHAGGSHVRAIGAILLLGLGLGGVITVFLDRALLRRR